MEFFESFPDITNTELASHFLFAYATAYMPKAPSLALCAAALSTDRVFYEKLQDAHKTRDAEALKTLCIHFNRNAWRFDPQLAEMNKSIREIYSKGRITKIARGEWTRPIWTPNTATDENLKTNLHIRNLQIPEGNNGEVPLVVLYKLGSFQRDPKLKAKLDRIFSPLANTFLVNTSGTGKTRLLYEGLCLHWGFYFTCALDSFFLGGEDIPSVVDEVDSEARWTPYLPLASSARHASSLQTNRNIVYRASGEALLARLLLFKMYLQACCAFGLCHRHRQQWLESQIFPDNITSYYDPFIVIKRDISSACISDPDLDEAIAHTLEEIQSMWDIPTGEFFYIVLDEANVASQKHKDAFEDEHGRYPILKEIIRALRLRVAHLPVKFVVAGTLIPEKHFRSNVGEWDDFHWCSDTGFFDNQDQHRHYVSQFLPPEFAKSIAGQALLKRMWQWLRGRHRYTAAFISILLANNFENTHTLLGNFVERVTLYMPHDNNVYSNGEDEESYNSWYSSLGSSGLREGSISTIEMHRSVTTFLTTSQGCTDCVAKERILITEDYGYFVDETCSQIALNEPMSVTFGAEWFTNANLKCKVTKLETFAFYYGTDTQPSHFALSLALSLASFFDGFSEVSGAFSISGLRAPLLKSKLVTFTRVSRQLEAADVHLSENTPHRLVMWASSPKDALSWFNHDRSEPFCLLQSSSNTSVTLVFCLQQFDERAFWVFVQVPSTFAKREPKFAHDIEDIRPSELFCDQPDIISLIDELPNPCLDVGSCGILRISGSFWANEVAKDNISSEHHPAGILNIEGLDEAADQVSVDMLMRRLSQIFAQGYNWEPKAPSLTIAIADIPEEDQKHGRFPTIVDDTGATSSVVGAQKFRSLKSIKVNTAGSKFNAARVRRAKTLRSSNDDGARVFISRTGKNRNGRAPARMAPDRINSTASSMLTYSYKD
ncbi:MAG: hypothetical protein NXY57DRAFT_1095772 [Lentinula lateritia]|nr:MAG: hypothetical protein NXY57DRAFT_1095772 [Lentinula lateritia]